MPSFASRRAAVEALAASVRDLADAAAATAVDPEVVAEITATIDGLRARLAAVTDDSPYSGLVQAPADRSVPEGPMPLNPVIGACSPSRPDVVLRFADGAVRGTARLTKRFTGPPGYAHGGIAAMLADQLVAVAPLAVGERCVTKQLHVRFRRPLPLDEPLELWGECEIDEHAGTITARYTITARGEVAVEGAGELVRYERLAPRND